MKHRTMQRAFTLLAVILLCFPLSAQKLTAEGMEILPNDATASMEDFQRQDLNGNYAGVVKVMLAVSGVTFEGGGVLEQQKHMDGEYWVWLAKDSKRLKVHAPGYLPLELNFYNDYKILIESRRTYRLVLTMPVAEKKLQNVVGQNISLQQLSINVEPQDAHVVINGYTMPVVNGVLNQPMPIGSYSYMISAEDYQTENGVIAIEEKNPCVLAVQLEKMSEQVSDEEQLAIETQLAIARARLRAMDQEISARISGGLYVEKFAQLEDSSYYSKIAYDINGNLCALLKVVTDQDNLIFEGGNFNVEKCNGYYLINIPLGCLSITIYNEKYKGSDGLENYMFPILLESGKVYEMELIATDGSAPSFGLG